MEMTQIDRTFAALSDPTRRRIVEVLAGRDAMRVSELATRFDTTRQAVTKHLDILCASGLVLTERQGRERLSSVAPEALEPIWTWLHQYDRFWNTKLKDLKELIERGGAS